MDYNAGNEMSMQFMQIEPFSSILRGVPQKALESMVARVHEQTTSGGLE